MSFFNSLSEYVTNSVAGLTLSPKRWANLLHYCKSWRNCMVLLSHSTGVPISGSHWAAPTPRKVRREWRPTRAVTQATATHPDFPKWYRRPAPLHWCSAGAAPSRRWYPRHQCADPAPSGCARPKRPRNVFPISAAGASAGRKLTIRCAQGKSPKTCLRPGLVCLHCATRTGRFSSRPLCLDCGAVTTRTTTVRYRGASI